MRTGVRTAGLIGGLILTTLLAGCPGLPGGAGQQQQVPSGVLPPPGLASGGGRTLMGAAVTAPDNNFLLVEYSYANTPAAQAGWQSCRRFMALDSCIVIEGLNYDGRNAELPKDTNKLLLYTGLTNFAWKYEPKPAPPAGAQERPQGRR